MSEEKPSTSQVTSEPFEKQLTISQPDLRAKTKAN